MAAFEVVFLLLSNRPFFDLSTGFAAAAAIVVVDANVGFDIFCIADADVGFLSIDKLFFRWILTFSGIGGGSLGLERSWILEETNTLCKKADTMGKVKRKHLQTVMQ